jgi:hypothetical protein
MIKILSGYNWLGEIGENTKEVDECIEKGLLKYLYDESNPTFIILERNIDAVKEILNGDYDKFTERNILEWIEFEYVGCYDELEIENAYGNKIAVNIDTIFGLISGIFGIPINITSFYYHNMSNYVLCDHYMNTLISTAFLCEGSIPGLSLNIFLSTSMEYIFHLLIYVK